MFNKIINVSVIGHVDSGKSTLCGQILYQLGLVNENEIMKLKLLAKEKKMDSWYLAYLNDTTEEERLKGKTIDYSINQIIKDNVKINLVDVPGHKYYIHNTMNALFLSDIVVLVISAKEGEFESGFEKMGQTKEHLLVTKGYGIQNVVVAINKIDEIEQNQDRINEIQNKITKYINLLNINIIGFVQVSALYGDNIIELIDKIISINKIDDSLFKSNICALVIEKFKDNNEYIGIKIINGEITKNTKIMQIEIQELYNKNFDKIDKACKNDIILVKTKNDKLEIGDIISDIKLQKKKSFNAKIKIINKIANIPIIVNGYECFVEMNLKTINAKIKFNNNTVKKILRVGDIDQVIIELDEDVIIIQNNFIIRNESIIIALGIISCY